MKTQGSTREAFEEFITNELVYLATRRGEIYDGSHVYVCCKTWQACTRQYITQLHSPEVITELTKCANSVKGFNEVMQDAYCSEDMMEAAVSHIIKIIGDNRGV